MSRDWTFFLEDILEAANKVLRYTNGLTLETFQRDELVFDAVVRNLEIIGEAALSDNPKPYPFLLFFVRRQRGPYSIRLIFKPVFVLNRVPFEY